MSDLHAELTQALDEAAWEWLEPHAKRDAVIVVAPHLTLVDVAVAIVNNQTVSVQHWIAEQLIAKPTLEQTQRWRTQPDRQFTALIVQPYVLIQEKG
jgi:hypothetical protein